MDRNDVRKLYSIGNAKWYDPLRPVYSKLFLSKAEGDLANFLKDNLDESKTVLELGCGTGANLEKIYSLNLEFKKYLGLDFSPDMLKIAKNKFRNNSIVEFRETDITELDDIKEQFDIIICIIVISHLQSRPDFVNKSQRLLNKNGNFFLILHTKPEWYINFWLFPFIWLSRMSLISDDEIKKFENIKVINKYSGNLITAIEIYR
ncbi:hypothetical protein IPdc08_00791 [archaeon]|nr:hypothetical protein IPdc08_00791 [archaeon]